jgi:hypothetical protein
MRPLRYSPERLLLTGAACAVLALGCGPVMEITASVTAKSCTDNAQTMRFFMQSTSGISAVNFAGGTPNVKGIPYGYSDGSTLHLWILCELLNVNRGDKVTVKMKNYVFVANTLTVSLADVAFFQAPWYTYPDIPDCAGVHTPQFTITQPVPNHGAAHATSSDGLTVQVTNPNALPMSLVQLDFAEAPDALDAALLDWDNPTLNALPWQATGGATLDVGAPPLTVDLPGSAAGHAILCRYISVYDGMEVDVIMQANLSPPLATKNSTWGGVKALYRD